MGAGMTMPAGPSALAVPTESPLPRDLRAAMLRGIRGRCPRCGEERLFGRYLKPVAACGSCGQDWTLHQADDFPPYISIFLTGHLLAPVIIVLSSSEALPMWAKMLACTSLAAALMFALLQPAKGAIIAMQWWMGMHGFRLAGRDEAGAEAGTG